MDKNDFVIFNSKDSLETSTLGGEFADFLRPLITPKSRMSVLALGPQGSGKSVLSRGIVNGFTNEDHQRMIFRERDFLSKQDTRNISMPRKKEMGAGVDIIQHTPPDAHIKDTDVLVLFGKPGEKTPEYFGQTVQNYSSDVGGIEGASRTVQAKLGLRKKHEAIASAIQNFEQITSESHLGSGRLVYVQLLNDNKNAQAAFESFKNNTQLETLVPHKEPISVDIPQGIESSPSAVPSKLGKITQSAAAGLGVVGFAQSLNGEFKHDINSGDPAQAAAGTVALVSNGVNAGNGVVSALPSSLKGKLLNSVSAPLGKVAGPLGCAATVANISAGIIENDPQRVAREVGSFAGATIGAIVCSPLGPIASAGCAVVGSYAGGEIAEKYLTQPVDATMQNFKGHHVDYKSIVPDLPKADDKTSPTEPTSRAKTQFIVPRGP